MSNLKDAGANLLNSLANDAEIVKDVYDNGLKPAVIETGKALTEPIKGVTRVGRFLNAICANIDCWILKRDYMIEETQKLLEKKLEKISNDDIEPPKNYIAIPALQALSYSIDSEELRNMYANLLAKSMYTETSANVHPAYIEIIRQMSPSDIKCFEEMYNVHNTIACKTVYIKNINDNTAQPYLPYISELDFFDLATVNRSLDNLLRLGLLDNQSTLDAHTTMKRRVDNNPYGIELIEKITKENLKENEVLECIYKIIGYSTLGFLFHEVCCKDIG